jgi:hypothetical protein
VGTRHEEAILYIYSSPLFMIFGPIAHKITCEKTHLTLLFRPITVGTNAKVVGDGINNISVTIRLLTDVELHQA